MILALKFGKGEELSKGVSTVLVVAICLFVVAYGWSWGPLGWLVPSELFPLEMRSAGQSVVVCVNLLWTAAVAQCSLAALIVVMSIFVILLLPETKQVPIEEIWMLFDRHWYWKRIVRRDPKYQGNLHQQQEMSRI